jgi:hypothetical protein
MKGDKKMKALKVRIQYNSLNVVEYDYPSLAYAKKVLEICDNEKAIAIKHAISREKAIEKFTKESGNLTADEFVKGIHSIIEKFGMIDYTYTDNE